MAKKLNIKRRFSNKYALLFAGLFIIVGTVTLLLTRAAEQSYAPIEAEDTTKYGIIRLVDQSASLISDSQASGGKAMQYALTRVSSTSNSSISGAFVPLNTQFGANPLLTRVALRLRGNSCMQNYSAKITVTANGVTGTTTISKPSTSYGAYWVNLPATIKTDKTPLYLTINFTKTSLSSCTPAVVVDGMLIFADLPPAQPKVGSISVTAYDVTDGNVKPLPNVPVKTLTFDTTLNCNPSEKSTSTAGTATFTDCGVPADRTSYQHQVSIQLNGYVDANTENPLVSAKVNVVPGATVSQTLYLRRLPVLSTTTQLFGYNGTGGATTSEALARIRATGATSARMGFVWAAHQPTPTSPVLSPYPNDVDPFYSTLSRSNEALLINVLGAPKWATDNPCSTNDSLCLYWYDHNRSHMPPGWGYIDKYAAHIAAIATRYPQAVIETWNEPNLGWFWRPEPINPEKMADMQCAAYDAVKKINPTQKVLSPGFAITTKTDLTSTTNSYGDRSMAYSDYVGRMYARMKGPDMKSRICWDGFNVHDYSIDDPAVAGSSTQKMLYGLRDFRSYFFKDTTPIWISEFGHPTGGKTGEWFHDEAFQQQVIRQHVDFYRKQSDIAGYYIHTLRDYDFPLAPTSRESFFGIFRKDGTAKPAACDLIKNSGNYWTGC